MKLYWQLCDTWTDALYTLCAAMATIVMLSAPIRMFSGLL